MEVTFAAVLAACGGWFRQRVLTSLEPVGDSETHTNTVVPFTRYYNPAEFQELTEPYSEARHRLRAKIAKKRWKMSPAYMGMPRLLELDEVVQEARETRTAFAVFWNHERSEIDELHDLVKQAYARLVGLEMDAEDARFEWLDQIAQWLDGIGALSLTDINSCEPEQWSDAVRQALDRHLAGAPPLVRRAAAPVAEGTAP